MKQIDNYRKDVKYAEGRTRTGTGLAAPGILSPILTDFASVESLASRP